MSELETKCDTPVSRKRVQQAPRAMNRSRQYERGVLVLGALCMTSAAVDVGAFVWAMVTGVRCQ